MFIGLLLLGVFVPVDGVGGLLCCVVCWWMLFYCAFDVGFVVMCLIRLFWLTLFCGVLLYGCLERCFLLVWFGGCL